MKISMLGLVGVLALSGCSARGGESLDSVSEALISTTQPLPIWRISRSFSGQITIAFKQPYLAPLYLNAIFITQVSSGPPVVGTVFPGSPPTGGNPAVGGRANLQVNPTEYANISRYIPPSGPLTVEVSYDTASNAVLDLTFTETL